MKHLPLHNQEFEALHIEFDRFIIARGYGNGKPVCYQSNIREFLCFIESKNIIAISLIKASHIIAYYEYIIQRPNTRTGKNLSHSMIRHQLFSQRLFFDYLIETGQVENSPARLPKFQVGEYAERNICNQAEIKLLFRACITKREKAILSVAYGCGLRRNEMHTLNTSDVLLSKGILIVREGKNNKSRTIPLSQSVSNNLRAYLVFERSSYFNLSNYNVNPAFFINDSGKRMRGELLNSLLKKIIERTKNLKLIQKQITLHCLRHSIATHLVDKGANIEFVQQFLGHSIIDTAHLYSKHRKRQLNRLLL